MSEKYEIYNDAVVDSVNHLCGLLGFKYDMLVKLVPFSNTSFHVEAKVDGEVITRTVVLANKRIHIDTSCDAFDALDDDNQNIALAHITAILYSRTIALLRIVTKITELTDTGNHLTASNGGTYSCVHGTHYFEDQHNCTYQYNPTYNVVLVNRRGIVRRQLTNDKDIAALYNAVTCLLIKAGLYKYS